MHAEEAMHEAVQAWAKLRGCCMSWPPARRDRRRLWWPTRAFNMIASHPARLPAAIRGAGVHRLPHFGKLRAACFVFGNGFSAGCVMPDHAGKQWRATIAER